jgi:hypothetical protein
MKYAELQPSVSNSHHPIHPHLQLDFLNPSSTSVSDHRIGNFKSYVCLCSQHFCGDVIIDGCC